MTAPTIRNRLGSVHGAGAEPRIVSREVASFALSSAAAAILLIAKSAGME